MRAHDARAPMIYVEQTHVNENDMRSTLLVNARIYLHNNFFGVIALLIK